MMAHQLNTDYLRRKLLNPQRQVSFLCSILLAFHPSPLAAAPQNSELFILLRHQHFALSLFYLSTHAVAIYKTLHNKEGLAF